MFFHSNWTILYFWWYEFLKTIQLLNWGAAQPWGQQLKHLLWTVNQRRQQNGRNWHHIPSSLVCHQLYCCHILFQILLLHTFRIPSLVVVLWKWILPSPTTTGSTAMASLEPWHCFICSGGGLWLGRIRRTRKEQEGRTKGTIHCKCSEDSRNYASPTILYPE